MVIRFALIQLVVFLLLASPALQAVADEAPNGPPAGTPVPSGASAAPDSEVVPLPELPEPVETVPAPPRKRWFPLFADKLGASADQLPNAYGIGMIGYWQKQDLIVKDVTIQIDDGPVKELDFLEFEDPSVKTNVAQVRADLWVLPFLNVSVMGGMLAGDATLPLAIEGSKLAEYFGREDLCDEDGPAFEFCNRRLESLGSTQYTGWNFGIGAVLAGGWRNFIIAVPANYVWSWVSILQQTVTAVTVSPRVGYRFNFGRFGVLTAYTGATYLKADIDVELSMKFDTTDSGVPELGDETELDVTVFQGNKDRWNMLVGGNWEIRKWVSLHCEGGFLGSRTNVAGSLTFRF